MEVRTDIEIAASSDKIWEVLADFAAYPEWNPVIVSVKGEPQAGARIQIKIDSGTGPALQIPVRVTHADPGKHLEWTGTLAGQSWLFAGRHYFKIEELGKDRCQFHHGEAFRGILPRLLWKRLGTQLTDAYSKMNEALKERVEKAS